MIPRIPTLTRPGGGQTVAVVGDLYTFLATGQQTDGRYAMWEAVVLPGGGPPPHRHRCEEEGFYVLEGEVTFEVNRQRQVAGPGTLLHLPIGVPHAFTNASSQPARMLIWVVPAGLEKMFQEVGQVVADRSASPPPVTEAHLQRLREAAARFGIDFEPPDNVPR